MKELMKKSHERENQEMNDKIAVCLGKGGQRDMAEAFCRRTGAQLQDKPGDFLTVRFDSRGVSLSGFGLTYQGDFVETMLHRVTRGRLQHENFLWSNLCGIEWKEQLVAGKGWKLCAFCECGMEWKTGQLCS